VNNVTSNHPCVAYFNPEEITEAVAVQRVYTAVEEMWIERGWGQVVLQEVAEEVGRRVGQKLHSVNFVPALVKVVDHKLW
jgi:hypothetical protein